MIAPTVSIPLVTTLALFWEKAGINQDVALDLLREALTEAVAMNYIIPKWKVTLNVIRL